MAGRAGGPSYGNGRIAVDDSITSTEQTALMVALVLLMGVILVLVIACVALILDLKTEKDINEILKSRIVKRMIQC